MSSRKGTLWTAEPHTIAKIEMLRSYLYQWFSILRKTFRGKDLWYLDGFAGPGEYTNYPEGSPVAALQAALSAINQAGSNWKAGRVHCAFIEGNRARFENLRERIALQPKHLKLELHTYCGSFAEGVSSLRQYNPNPFETDAPLFAFIDPFGPSGLSFSAVRDLIASNAREILLNLDSDGISRILTAGEDAKHREILDGVFGDSEWLTELVGMTQAENVQRALNLYKGKLRAIPGVDYAFSFEMRKKSDVFDYHLVFAGHHPRGLEKMKQVMRRIDQDGSYCFSDDHVGQGVLFDFNDPGPAAQTMLRHFQGRTVLYSEVNRYALNESPFTNPKSMLKALELDGTVTVHSVVSHRARTYPEAAQLRMQISFAKGS